MPALGLSGGWQTPALCISDGRGRPALKLSADWEASALWLSVSKGRSAASEEDGEGDFLSLCTTPSQVSSQYESNRIESQQIAT